MEVTDGETETSVDLKAAVGSEHYDTRWLEGVVPGEDQLAVVVASCQCVCVCVCVCVGGCVCV